MRDIPANRLKIIVTFLLLFFLVSVLLLLVFYAGKKSYTVTFDLDGGTLISGSLEQNVTLGQDAVPPVTVKQGAYLRGWSTSYKKITRDTTVQAVWEYETTPGIIYSINDNQNFAEIESAYKYINGEIYLGAYYQDKKVLGIREEAFSDCIGITKVYLLDGLLSIGKNAFKGCVGLTEIAMPDTIKSIGNGAFEGCENLEVLVLNDGLWEIGDYAFANCKTLKTVVIPASVKRIGNSAFSGCESLENVVFTDSVGTIGQLAFADCMALTEIVLPGSIALIQKDAFLGCENLTIYIRQTEQDYTADWEEGWQGSAPVEEYVQEQAPNEDPID